MSEDSNPIKNLPKLGALALAIVYFLGFLAVTVSLSRYGVVPASLLRFQYLVAGVWLLLMPASVVLAGVIYYWLGLRFRGKLLGFLPWRDLGALLIVFMAISSLYLTLLGLFPLFAKSLFNAKWYILACIALVGGGWFSLNRVLTMKASSSTLEESFRIENFANRLTFLAVFGVSLYILLFSTQIYPLIPSTLGGGKPLPVVFLLKSSEPAESVPLERGESPRRSIRYELLLSTETAYIVKSRNQNEKAIEFSRDIVLGMIVMGDEQEVEEKQKGVKD